MADTVLGGRWIINYEADNRQKSIVRDTNVSATTIDSVNALYSALQDQFDELAQMDDGSPMSAQTPTEYTIGIIDAGEKNPWFMDRTSMEYLKGGAIKTASWKRNPLVGDGTGTIGIIQIKYTATTNLDPTDIGRDILMTTDGDRGTILDFNDTGATKFMWIRPDSNLAADSFNNAPTNGGAFTIGDAPDNLLGQIWQVVASGPTYSDQTAAANNATANDWTIFPAGANADYVTIGFRQKFKKFTMNVGTAGAGTYTVPVTGWDYWNGSSWTDLAGVTDGTNGFKTAGTNNVTFTVPTDWATTSLGGSAQLYFIRAVKDTGTVTTAPLGTQGFIGVTGATLAQVNIAGAGTAVTGESLWANIYSLGSIEFATHLYVYQNAVILKKYKSTTIDWWGDGQIDILVSVKELDVETDEGVVTVFGRQYSKTYDNFIVDLTAGGRNPIPLATGADLNNTTGYRQITSTTNTGAGTFNVNNFIYVGSTWATATKRGRITKVAGTSGASSNPILDYYLLGDLTYADFAASDAVKEFVESTGADGDATMTTQAPINAPSSPSTFTTITAVHANNSVDFDIDEVSPNENYSIVVDLVSARTVAEGYEWSKYITRGGGTTTGNTDGIEGERYIGSDYRLQYSGTISGTINESDTVSQAVSLAKGSIVASHVGTIKIIILRDSRGTFNTTGLVTSSPGGGTVTPNTSATALTAIKAAPFGTFAGGTWFGAPGVVFKNTLAADANKYQLTDDNGNVVKAPTKVTITVGNTIASDRVAVFRLTAAGGTINKATYNATAQAIEATTVVVTPNIAVDEPGKSAGGILRLVDASASREYRLRFSSWATATFTLANQTGTMDNTGGTTTTTNIHDDGKLFLTTNLVKVGDLVYNKTRSAVAYVTVVVDADDLTISPAITGQVSGDIYFINVLPVATTTSPQDTVYVPLIDSFETTGTSGTPGTEEATVTFSANIPVRVRARRTVATAILPYEADSTVTSTGMSNNIIRTADTIFT